MGRDPKPHVNVHVRMDSSIYERMLAYARAHGRTMTEVIETAVDVYTRPLSEEEREE